MLEEPPLLQIAKRAHRVLTDDEIAPFRGTLTGNICDALGGGGALEHSIKPVTPDTPNVAGQALTIDCGPADILGFKAGITQLRAGDVMVVSTGGWTGCASVGDLTCGMAKNTGAAAIVTDGMVRDVGGIRGPRIDHGNVTGPEYVGAGAVKGERTWVFGDDAADARRDLGHLPVGELQITSIRYVPAHAAKNNPSS